MAKKSCKKGYYYCYSSKKCKKIPKGWHVMPTGYLMRDDQKHSDEEETKKKNGNGTNGNGNGNGDSSGSSDGGGVSEGWSAKYKKSIDCDNPKGFSQRAHCQGRKKVNEAKGHEKDHEVSMAQSQLKKSERNIAILRKKLGKKERNIPAWVQAKITDTEHNTDAAAGYMEEGKRDGKSAKSKDYSLHDWFKGGGWVQAGGKYDGKPCAKQPGQKTKPFCRDADDRASMSKDERNRRAAKKRKEDPNPNRKGKAKMVTDNYSDWRNELVVEGGGFIRVGNQQVNIGDYRRPQPQQSTPPARPSAATQQQRLQMYNQRRREAPVSRPAPTPAARPAARPAAKPVQAPTQNRNYGDIGNPMNLGGNLRFVMDRAAQRNAVLQQLKQGYELEGELVDEGKKDACYKKVKSRYSVWPSAYASGALVKCRKVGAKNWGNKTQKEGYEFSNWRDDFQALEYESVDIIKAKPLQPTKGIGSDMLGEKCWDGYTQKGMKKKGNKVVPNCVKEEEKKAKKDYDGDGKIESGSEEYLGSRDKAIKKAMGKKKMNEDWQKVNKKDKTDGMSQKAVNAYKRENPGSNLKTAVTEKNPGGKRAKRRKSFCARSNGQRKMHNIDCSATPDKAICKARKRWRC